MSEEPMLAAQGLDPREDGPIRERIERLLREEPFAVLATHGEGQAYSSLVAFAASEDSRSLVFATPVTTRKYRLLTERQEVSLLIDNRAATGQRLMEVEAVTAVGRALRVEHEERWSRLLVARHGYLGDFVRAPTCAVFRVEVTCYLHVARFQEVRQWKP